MGSLEGTVAIVIGASRGIGRGGRHDWSEPMETMAEAALALCSGDPRELTGRVTTSLSFLVERDRPVHTLDGRALVPGWQPGEFDPARLMRPHLTAFAD